MKLTRKILKEMILKELSGTTGGSADIAARKKVASDVKTKKSTKKTRKSTWDTKVKTQKTKQSNYDTKLAAYNTAKTDYNTKNADLTAFNSRKYRKAQKGGGYLYSSTLQKGYSLNPDWTTKNTEKSNALRDRNTALSQKRTADTEKDSAESDKESKERTYQIAVDNLTAAKKQALAMKAQTGFGFGAGGTAVGTGKASGTGKKGGKKDESLFRILGRDLMNEIKDIKKYS